MDVWVHQAPYLVARACACLPAVAVPATACTGESVCTPTTSRTHAAPSRTDSLPYVRLRDAPV